jgi:O-antigen ligase
MTQTVLSHGRFGRVALAYRKVRPLRRVRPIIQTHDVKWILRYTFYAAIFLLPFEEAYVAGGTTLPKLFGLALAGLALLQPRLCYKFPPKAFWCFASYLLVFAVWGLYLLLAPPNVPDFSTSLIAQFKTLLQLLLLFWLSYNLLTQENVFAGALWALAAATIMLAMLQLAGVTSDVSNTGRVAAFEGNPNGLATVLSLGLLALFGLAYGRHKHEWKGRVLFWLGAGILAIAMVQTGSRGTLVALVGSLSIFFLRGRTLATKLKFAGIAAVGIVVLGVASYRIEAVRVRWEKTFYDEDIAGRDKIYAQTMGMILERPLIGWGPINHLWELGPRVRRPYRDEHNVYLWILAEVGLLGAVPFFAGLWLCWRAAWKGRHGLQGILPLVMLLFLLTASMKGTIYKNKYYWVVLSIALAANSYSGGSQRSRSAFPLRYPEATANWRNSPLASVQKRSRLRRLPHSS